MQVRRQIKNTIFAHCSNSPVAFRNVHGPDGKEMPTKCLVEGCESSSNLQEGKRFTRYHSEELNHGKAKKQAKFACQAIGVSSARVMPHDVITPETRRQCYFYS